MENLNFSMYGVKIIDVGCSITKISLKLGKRLYISCKISLLHIYFKNIRLEAYMYACTYIDESYLQYTIHTSLSIVL